MKALFGFKKYFSGLTKNSVLLAFASLFSDISTEMLYPILPTYLTETLHLSGGIIGIIDGLAQASQNAIQGISGYFSDKFQKRKPIAIFGYVLSAISKPVIGLASIWPTALAARISDRLGSGIRSAPRDAMIASSVDLEHRGKAFGLEGIGDNLGAFLGPLLTVLLFFVLKFNIHSIFYFALAPGLFAVLMILLVKEDGTKNFKAKFELKLQHFPKNYWKYLFITALFGIGNSSNAFLILQLNGLGLSLTKTVIIYAFYNLIAALISYPAGLLSDKFGRKLLLLISFTVFFISHLGFGFVSNMYVIGLLFIFYGLFQGIFRAVGKSFATDLIPREIQASGVGWYSTVVGVSGLFASVIAGQLWDQVSHVAVFFYGSVCSLIGILALIFLFPNQKFEGEIKI